MVVSKTTALPAPLEPLIQVWTFRPEGGVFAVPGMDHSFIRVRVKEPGLHVIEEPDEISLAGRLSQPTGEEAVADEEMGNAIEFDGNGDPTWGVATQDTHRELMAGERKDIILLQIHIRGDRQSGSIEERAVMSGSGGLEDLFEGPDMVCVAMGGQDSGNLDTSLLSELQQRGGVVRGVDKQPLPASGEKVTVVVHLGDGDPVQGEFIAHVTQRTDAADIRRGFGRDRLW